MLRNCSKKKFRDRVVGFCEAVAEESVETGQGLIHCTCKTGCSAAAS